MPDQSDDNPDQAGAVLDVDAVAAELVDAIRANELYVVPHAESREFVRRRFERIERA